MTIIPITVNSLPLFQSIRLRSLKQDPHAFGSTYAREVMLRDEEWQQRLTRWSGDRGIGLLAMEGDIPQGIIGLLVVDDSPHTAEVVSMWVAPDARRSGVGGTLLAAVERWAADHFVHTLRLAVRTNNTAALAFYQHGGFAITETTACNSHAGLHEYTMTKRLSGRKLSEHRTA